MLPGICLNPVANLCALFPILRAGLPSRDRVAVPSIYSGLDLGVRLTQILKLIR